MSIMGHYSVNNLRKKICNNPNLDVVYMGNEILTSIKGHNSVTNLRKIIGDNPNLDLVNINAYLYKIM